MEVVIMTHKREVRQSCFPKGFTLIELLVVVLIIGILAAVAVPQYQKAVKKARFAEVKTQINTLMRAIDMYILEHGDVPITFSMDDLDISVPQGKNATCIVKYESYIGNMAWIDCRLTSMDGYINLSRTASTVWEDGGGFGSTDPQVLKMICEYMEQILPDPPNQYTFSHKCIGI